MTRYIYTARLVPLGRAVRIPDADEPTRRDVYEFTTESFTLERTSKGRVRIPVLVDHDPALRVGEVGLLYVRRDWFCADFQLDRDIPDDIEFDIGQPISVGIDKLLIGSEGVFLREVSLVSRAAVSGAEIVSRWPIPEPRGDQPPRRHPRPPQRRPDHPRPLNPCIHAVF